jgi:hypothetical protein
VQTKSLGFTRFAKNFMHLLRELWEACVARYGIMWGPHPDARLPDPVTRERLLHNSGFERVEVHTEPLEYYLTDGEARC